MKCWMAFPSLMPRFAGPRQNWILCDVDCKFVTIKPPKNLAPSWFVHGSTSKPITLRLTCTTPDKTRPPEAQPQPSMSKLKWRPPSALFADCCKMVCLRGADIRTHIRVCRGQIACFEDQWVSIISWFRLGELDLAFADPDVCSINSTLSLGCSEKAT